MTTLLKVQAPQCSIQENTTSDLSAPQYPNLPWLLQNPPPL
jgi:hypothetical protein